MCGICGAFAHGRAAGLEQDTLLAMRERLVHRGPDDEGAYLSPDRRAGLGFRRLSIVDLSPAGHQPMSNEDGSVWIAFNGEIYNHAEHRPALMAKGHVYRSRSDTETILHLYEEHGADCVHQLRGMFAFALWDARKRRLLLARDRMGLKPLYYVDRGGLLVFASEIKALLAYPGLSRDLDEQALSHYLAFMAPPAPLTLFAGVRKLAAGHRLIAEEGGEVRVEPYWDPLCAPGQPPESEAECAEAVRALLDESVRLRMMSDVPVGAFLSGGIDSSSIVALMARHSSRPVLTFTVGYKDSPASNELAFARQVAREFGTDHHEVMVGGDDVRSYLPELIRTEDEPLGDPVCVPLYYVSRLAHDSGVKVVLLGEGSDELFCGYPWYLHYLAEERQWARLGAFPPAAARGLYHVAADVLRQLGRGYTVAEMLDRRRLGRWTFWGGSVVFSGWVRDRLLQPAFRIALANDGFGVVDAVYRHALDLRPGLDGLGRMTYLELRHRLPELLLMRVDRITMSVSVEARVPFLDHRLVEFALSLPMGLKIGSGPKSLLKRAVRGLIPQAIVDRPKQGFPAPVTEWFATLPSGELAHTLLNGPLARRGYFDPRFIRYMLDRHARGRRGWSTHLWVLYNLSLWYSHWIEGEAAA